MFTSTCYGVPLSTLSDHITGKVQFGKKSEPSQYLTESEELELKNFGIWIRLEGNYSFGTTRNNPECKIVMDGGIVSKGDILTVFCQPELLSRVRQVTSARTKAAVDSGSKYVIYVRHIA